MSYSLAAMCKENESPGLIRKSDVRTLALTAIVPRCTTYLMEVINARYSSYQW